MANMQQTHLPSNKDLEAESIRRFELYQALKTEHQRRKGDLKQTLEREKTRVQKESQDAKHHLEEQLVRHVKEHNAEVNDEDRQYHKDLTDFRRQSSRETRPGHSPSTEEMEAEETRLFEAFQRVRTEHGRRMNRFNRDVESRKEDIRAKMQELDERLPRCLAEYTALLEKEDQRYKTELKEFQRQRVQEYPTESSLQHNPSKARPLHHPAENTAQVTAAESSSAARSPQNLEQSPGQSRQISEPQKSLCGTKRPGSPLTNLPIRRPPPQQQQQPPILASSPAASQQPKTTQDRSSQPLKTHPSSRTMAQDWASPRAGEKIGGRSEGPSPDPDIPVAKKQKTMRTILFDEVNAETKDWRFEEISIIVEYPIKSNMWYILRCQQCGLVLFTTQGAGQHLSGRTHGSTRRWGEAVKQLGVHVVDCDAKKARRNNDAFELACLQGHNPKRRLDGAPWRFHGSCHDKPTASRQEDEIEDMPDSELDLIDDGYVPSGEEIDEFMLEKESQKQPFLGVAEPVAGELYQAYWGADNTWYLVTVLPLGGFQEIGIAGHLQDLDLELKIPPCYEVDGDSFHIIGWKDGFNDGGSCVTEREFPCFFFSVDFEVPLTGEFGLPNGRHYAWMSAKDLRQIDYSQPGAHNANSSGRIAAENFRKRVAAMGDPRPAAQPEADMVGQSPGSRSEEQQHGHNASHEDSNAKTVHGVHQELQGGSMDVAMTTEVFKGASSSTRCLTVKLGGVLAWGSISRAGGGESKNVDDTGGVHHEISSLPSGQAPKDGPPVAL
ncbi:hypothetical protein VP1G_04519 [Cytospora mali]|uniref:C2H2-type domain-containing protein n=1 Tax=Cytospora mali TaxID=578113 RepID=A0A194UZV9_CYTMA|nr:hypothetical protein VP1G_04519 [Valsa mali var. pyri (nom. inval.)]